VKVDSFGHIACFLCDFLRLSIEYFQPKNFGQQWTRDHATTSFCLLLGMHFADHSGARGLCNLAKILAHTSPDTPNKKVIPLRLAGTKPRVRQVLQR
jgi:hypothetical protein